MVDPQLNFLAVPQIWISVQAYSRSKFASYRNGIVRIEMMDGPDLGSFWVVEIPQDCISVGLIYLLTEMSYFTTNVISHRFSNPLDGCIIPRSWRKFTDVVADKLYQINCLVIIKNRPYSSVLRLLPINETSIPTQFRCFLSVWNSNRNLTVFNSQIFDRC